MKNAIQIYWAVSFLSLAASADQLTCVVSEPSGFTKTVSKETEKYIRYEGDPYEEREDWFAGFEIPSHDYAPMRYQIGIVDFSQTDQIYSSYVHVLDAAGNVDPARMFRGGISFGEVKIFTYQGAKISCFVIRK